MGDDQGPADPEEDSLNQKNGGQRMVNEGGLEAKIGQSAEGAGQAAAWAGEVQKSPAKAKRIVRLVGELKKMEKNESEEGGQANGRPPRPVSPV